MTRPTILVPVDFTAGSAAAVRLAHLIALGAGARCELIHALVGPAAQGTDHPLRGPLRELADDQTLERAHELIDAVGLPGVDLDSITAVQAPTHEAILGLLSTRRYDLVVLGHDGVGGLRQRLFGSLLTDVLDHARCPVITARAGSALPTWLAAAPISA